MSSMTFGALRQANDTRQMEWPGNEKADVAFRTIEVAGEFGEVSEAVKKHLRAERRGENSNDHKHMVRLTNNVSRVLGNFRSQGRVVSEGNGKGLQLWYLGRN